MTTKKKPGEVAAAAPKRLVIVSVQFVNRIDGWGRMLTDVNHTLEADPAGVLVTNRNQPGEVDLVPWANIAVAAMRSVSVRG